MRGKILQVPKHYSYSHSFECLNNPNIQEEEIDFSKIDTNIIEIDLINSEYKFPLNNIPSHIISLKLNANYNQPLDNLPQNLKQLILGQEFNQPLNYLPDGLEILYIGIGYTQDLMNLPKSLQTLTLNTNGIDNINFDLPNLTNLNFNYMSDKLVKSESFIYQLTKLSNTLKELYLPSFMYEHNISIDLFQNFECLEILHIGNYNKYINQFPKNLKHLILYNYNHPICDLPDTLEILEVSDNFEYELRCLPPNLKKLDMGENKECDILIDFPESLEEIVIIETHPQCRELKLTNLHYYNNSLKITTTIDWDAREEQYNFYLD